MKKSIFRSLGAIIALACLSFASSAQTLDFKTHGTVANVIAVSQDYGQAKCPSSVTNVIKAKSDGLKHGCSTAFWRMPTKPNDSIALTNYTLSTSLGYGLRAQTGKAVERYAKRSG